MNNKPSYLLWEGLPFLMVLGTFGFISLMNWSYESKLVYPDIGAHDWASIHLGIILLAAAIGLTTLASVILFLVRLCSSKLNMSWFVSLTVVAIFFIFPSLFIVIMGPASITMMEQVRTPPRDR